MERRVFGPAVFANLNSTKKAPTGGRAESSRPYSGATSNRPRRHRKVAGFNSTFLMRAVWAAIAFTRTCRVEGGHMWIQNIVQEACPICGKETTLAVIEPHPTHPEMELHTYRCVDCGALKLLCTTLVQRSAAFVHGSLPLLCLQQLRRSSPLCHWISAQWHRVDGPALQQCSCQDWCVASQR